MFLRSQRRKHFGGAEHTHMAMEYKTDLDKLRHSTSHVMAEAVQNLWPDVKVTIGPAIENGFYYDFDRKEPFTPEDLEKKEKEKDIKKIKKEMRKTTSRNPAFNQSFMPRKDAIELFKKKNETYKVELIEGIPDEKVSIFQTGGGW